MRPSTSPLEPRKSSFWPGVLALGAAVVLFVVLSRISKKDKEENQAAEQPIATALAAAPKPSGAWTLLKQSNDDGIQTTLPKVGRVALLRKRYGIGTRLWVRLPEHADPVLIQATAQFGKLAPVRVPINKTDANGIACIYIPQNYPEGCRSCVVNLRQDDIDLSSQTVEGLPPTVRVWPKSVSASGPIKCGPGEISAKAWVDAPSSENNLVTVQLSASINPKPGENWEFAREIKEIPTYVPAKYAPHILDGETLTPYSIVGGKFSMSMGVGLDLPAIQGVYHARGVLRRYETADEEVEFRNIPARTDYRSPDGTTITRLTNPAEAVTATSPSGVKVTLLPGPKDSDFLTNLANEKILLVNCLVSPIENSPLDLPKSPVLRGRKGTVRIQLNDSEGKIILRPASFAKQLPDWIKARDKRKWVVIGIDATPYSGDVIPSLRFKIRHRFEAEVHPFSFSVPIHPSRPTDALDIKMPPPAR